MEVWVISLDLNLLSAYCCVVNRPQRWSHHCCEVQAHTNTDFTTRNCYLNAEGIFWVKQKLYPSPATQWSIQNLSWLIDCKLKKVCASIRDLTEKNFKYRNLGFLYNSCQVIPTIVTKIWIRSHVTSVDRKIAHVARQEVSAPKRVLGSKGNVCEYILVKSLFANRVEIESCRSVWLSNP